ncbi:MAG: SAM-dependent methyltransferase [Waterburya sp.]
MKLKEVVPWGRTLEEYKLMFALSEADLNTRILGCGDGPASFNAEMSELGYFVQSIDPIYQFSAAQIKTRVQENYDLLISQVKQNSDRYIWKNFQNADELGQARLMAMEKFLRDYETGKLAGRYLPQSLPSLGFSDHQFKLCLCSHFLFLYSDQLSWDFHLDSMYELLRVSQEVRIFPLLKLNCERSPYLDPIMQDLVKQNFNVQVVTVPYEFQKGGNQMLKVSRFG